MEMTDQEKILVLKKQNRQLMRDSQKMLHRMRAAEWQLKHLVATLDTDYIITKKRGDIVVSVFDVMDDMEAQALRKREQRRRRINPES
ncbi:MAG: hypothetical protein K6D57_08090 [Paludibacteraceae bacterium]|jgi:hypothetical protein|nr:hypothetical protein [Paludibacteraceae bacterium]